MEQGFFLFCHNVKFEVDVCFHSSSAMLYKGIQLIVKIVGSLLIVAGIITIVLMQ